MLRRGITKEDDILEGTRDLAGELGQAGGGKGGVLTGTSLEHSVCIFMVPWATHLVPVLFKNVSINDPLVKCLMSLLITW